MAIITTLTEEPTGPLVSQLPVLIPAFGVAGYGTRWTAKQLSVAVGSVVPSWPGHGGQTLVTSGAPTLVDSLGVRAVAYDGVDDKSQIDLFSVATQRTVFAVIRVAAAAGVNTGILSDASVASFNPAFVRTGSNQLGLFSPSGGATTIVESGVNAWGLVTLRFDATTSKFTWNSTNSGNAATTIDRGMNALRLGVGGGAFGKVEIAEFISYPQLMTDAEVAVVKNELKKLYPTLP